jgi:S-adenosylmethionine:tRNA ribosyltransferase-isomerase
MNAIGAPLRVEDLTYALPRDRIADRPVEPRESARLLVVRWAPTRIAHHRVADLPHLLRPGDILVLNRTRVIKARLDVHKTTGGRVTVVVVAHRQDTLRALLQKGKLKPGQTLQVGPHRLTCVARQGKWVDLTLPREISLEALLEIYGHMPLPPYIPRDPSDHDETWYQPSLAREPGSIAAPTASLHLTPALLHALQARGIQLAEVVLHVGPGTFLPIQGEHFEDHRMLEEPFRIPPETRAVLQEARRSGRRIVAVGTTVVRALETWAWGEGPAEGTTELFIYPGYTFRVIQGFWTNFHQPRSTPLAMVAAFAGWERVKTAYLVALDHGYRFLSYGDATLWLPEDGDAGHTA